MRRHADAEGHPLCAALATADTLGVALPAAQVTDDLLTTARELGYEDRDIAVMIEVLQHGGQPSAAATRAGPGGDGVNSAGTPAST